MSTDPLGEISVNGGLGTININNQTGVGIVLQNLYAGSAASAAASSSTVELIDTTKMVHTVYLYQGGQVYTYTGTVTGVNSDGTGIVGQTAAQLEAGTATSVGGTSVTYDPQTGQRWNWTLQASLSRTDNFGDQNTWSIGQWQWNMPTGQPNDPWSYCASQYCYSTTLTPTGYLVTSSRRHVRLRRAHPRHGRFHRRVEHRLPRLRWWPRVDLQLRLHRERDVRLRGQGSVRQLVLQRRDAGDDRSVDVRQRE